GELPAVFGHEAAGTVEEVGAGVEAVEAGDAVVVTLARCCGRCYFCARGRPLLCDAVFALDRRSPLAGGAIAQGLRVGAFADLVTVHASQAIRVPVELTFASAALLACAVPTGAGAVVNDADVTAGSSVVVVG